VNEPAAGPDPDPLSLVLRAVAIYEANPRFDESAVAEALMSEGTERTAALLAALLLPSIFGCVLVVHGLGAQPIDRFMVQSADGDWVAYLMGRQPIARAVTRVAVATYVHGPRERFQSIAYRSAEVKVANELLHSGAEIEGATLEPPRLHGVVAEQVGIEGRA